MKTARATALALATTVTAALLLGAAPAAAAELPEEDALYTVASDQGLFQLWQLLSVNPVNAEVALVGASDTPVEGESQAQGSYDPATGTAYFVGKDLGVSLLMTVDLVTGEWEEIGPIVVDPDGTPVSLDVTALAIGAGSAAFAITESSQLYGIDLATGEATAVGPVGHFHAFAFDAITNAYYALNDSGDLYEVDVTDGSTTLVTTVGFPEPTFYFPYSLQFDSAGAAWVLVNSDAAPDALYSFTFLDTEPVLSGVLSYEGEEFGSESLLLVPAQAPTPPPAPLLPATGADATIALTLSGLLLAAGFGFVVVRRRAQDA